VHLKMPDHKIPLSKDGKNQARNLNIDLDYDSFESVRLYSSPYKRAVMTYKLSIPRFYTCDLEPLVSERRIRYKWGTEHYKQIIEQWKKKGSFWWEGFDHGFESGMDVYQRANIFLSKINHKHFSGNENTCVVVFTHGYFMQMMRIALIGDEGIDFDDQRRNPENTEQWIFESYDGVDWELTEEIVNSNVETNHNNIPV